MKISMKKVVVLALAATFLGTSISSLADEVESRRLSIIKVTGDNATVTKNHKRSVPAAEGVNLGQGNSVKTGKQSNVYIEADGDKILKLEENTLVEISKASAKSLKLTLESGQIFFNVEKPLAADEELTFSAAQTSMSIRGTSGIFDMDAQTLQFRLVDGAVEWNLGDQTIRVTPGQEVELERFWGDQKPGPGVEKIYHLKSVDNYDWTDLDHETLGMLLENQDTIDLSGIGLHNAQQIQAAEEHVAAEQERIRLEQEEAERRRQEYLMLLEEEDDDDYEETAAVETTTQTEITTEEETTTQAETTTEEETTTQAETTTEEETTTQATQPSTEEPTTAPGEYLYSANSSGNVWVEYDATSSNPNGSYDANNEWQWNQTFLDENNYSVLVATE